MPDYLADNAAASEELGDEHIECIGFGKCFLIGHAYTSP
jgi:hypothetical protein